MIAYQKLRISVASNGAFKSNALLVKVNGDFTLLTDERITGIADAIITQRHISFSDGAGRTLTVAAGAGRSLFSGVSVDNAEFTTVFRALFQPTDSFASACLALQERLPFNNYRYETVDNGVVLADGSNAIADFAGLFSAVETAAATISGVAFKDGYTRTNRYRGMGGYHSNQHRHAFNTPLVADKPWRIGVELELYARTRNDFDKITETESNWFQCERDGSLSENIGGVSGLGIEIKTIPLKACDAKSVDFWAEPMAELTRRAKSKGCTTTGLHVHIGKEILGNNDAERQRTLDKLTWFYYYLIEDIQENHRKNVTICGRERGYSTNVDAGKTELADFAKSIGFDTVQKVPDAFKKMAGSVKDKIRNQRDDINIAHLNDYGTIEFRKGKGIIGKTRMAAIVTWWEQMCLYCRETAPQDLSFDAFFAKVTRENPAVAYFFNQDDEA
jgi:hypothetical protein